ncbi:hypothetical protein COO20_00580 [Thalassospira marina]|uniref:Uncharacterized protein n=1 Tax=Thalassospira marina TaxID=2048283 RepID=A0A2N3KYV5_9PROT|nr:hypothetical protein COO20_00580 [Thalassospira marina]
MQGHVGAGDSQKCGGNGAELALTLCAAPLIHCGLAFQIDAAFDKTRRYCRISGIKGGGVIDSAGGKPYTADLEFYWITFIRTE